MLVARLVCRRAHAAPPAPVYALEARAERFEPFGVVLPRCASDPRFPELGAHSIDSRPASAKLGHGTLVALLELIAKRTRLVRRQLVAEAFAQRVECLDQDHRVARGRQALPQIAEGRVLPAVDLVAYREALEPKRRA